MRRKNKNQNVQNENAKNPDWQVPVNLPGVKPEEYEIPEDLNPLTGKTKSKQN